MKTGNNKIWTFVVKCSKILKLWGFSFFLTFLVPGWYQWAAAVGDPPYELQEYKGLQQSSLPCWSIAYLLVVAFSLLLVFELKSNTCLFFLLVLLVPSSWSSYPGYFIYFLVPAKKPHLPPAAQQPFHHQSNDLPLPGTTYPPLNVSRSPLSSKSFTPWRLSEHSPIVPWTHPISSFLRCSRLYC